MTEPLETPSETLPETASGTPAVDDPEPEPAVPANGAETEDDWRAVLADDERSFAEQFASPADAVRAALEMRRKLSTSVPLPGPDDGPEKRLAVLDRLGRPESPDGYEIAVPENLPGWIDAEDPDLAAAQQSFLAAMHGAGATQDMVDAALSWYWERLAETDGAQAQRLDSEFEAAETALRREWGREFEGNVEHAARAVAAFGGEALGEALEQYGLANHPAVIRAFARIGRAMGEDETVSGRISETTRDQLRARAEALVADDDYWTSEAHQREMREIMLRLYGDAGTGRETTT